VRYDPHRRYHRRPRPRRDSPFRIVYEDGRLIVVDKPAGVLTVPTDRGETGTLVDALGDYLGRGVRRARVEVVQRLDRDASGLLVFGKDEEAGLGLRAQFEAHTPEREYGVLVKGRMAAAEGTLRSRLTTGSDLRRYSTDRRGEGEEAVTHYRVERVLPGATLVRARLETGRRNQIRVHFAEAGHPVLGDRRYGPAKTRRPLWTASRLALHAAVLGFRHPATGEALRFESPLPRAFRDFLRKDFADSGRNRRGLHG
jgi:23S rRNA pseudouridine1911/1915/1917 synthase